MSEYVPETLPKITEEDWKSFAEKLKPYFTKEHQEIAKQIPCDDEELRMAFAMLMPGVSVQIDHSDLLFSTLPCNEWEHLLRPSHLRHNILFFTSSVI
ncbi:MAG: hypothetical protein WCJ72_17575 [Chryseobacterium sp.]